MWAWALLPVSLFLLGTIGFWAVYGIAVSNNSVNLTVEFPYISTCGSYTPQSCYFAQILNVGAFLVIWICLVRYQQIKDYERHSRLNTASLVLGFISAIGISVVGNFQQTVLLGVHMFGAFLAFFIGLAYFWIQVYLTFKVKLNHGGKWIGTTRTFLCIICTILIISMAVLHKTGSRSAAAGCEWLAAMTFFMLFASFAVEFRHVEQHSYHVMHKEVDTTMSVTL